MWLLVSESENVMKWDQPGLQSWGFWEPPRAPSHGGTTSLLVLVGMQQRKHPNSLFTLVFHPPIHTKTTICRKDSMYVMSHWSTNRESSRGNKSYALLWKEIILCFDIIDKNKPAPLKKFSRDEICASCLASTAQSHTETWFLWGNNWMDTYLVNVGHLHGGFTFYDNETKQHMGFVRCCLSTSFCQSSPLSSPFLWGVSQWIVPQTHTLRECD